MAYSPGRIFQQVTGNVQFRYTGLVQRCISFRQTRMHVFFSQGCCCMYGEPTSVKNVTILLPVSKNVTLFAH